jgi:predicted GIY-YIG superfamily endonuclease
VGYGTTTPRLRLYKPEQHEVQSFVFESMAGKKTKPDGYYCYKRVMKIARDCKDYAEFQKNHRSAAQAAQKHGWVADVKAVLPHKTYWNYELCKKEIKDKGYKNKKEFRNGSPGGYSWAYEHGCLDELCKDLEILGNHQNRIIYIYEFDDGCAYVGLTGNKSERNAYHTHNRNSPVCQHIKDVCNKYELKYISDWMSKEDAQICEDDMINKYAAAGWKMLNRAKGGGLGAPSKPKFSLDELKVAAATCSHRKEYHDKFPAYYAFLLNHNLLDEVLGEMPTRYTPPPPIWNDDRLSEIVKECNYDKTLFRKKYKLAYHAIAQRGEIEKFFGEKREQHSWTIKSAIEESKQYKSYNELIEKNIALYTFIYRNNLQSVCFPDGGYKAQHTNFTWADIDAAINASSNLTQMRKEHTYEYRAALRREEWRRELYKRLPSRKHKSNL